MAAGGRRPVQGTRVRWHSSFAALITPALRTSPGAAACLNTPCHLAHILPAHRLVPPCAAIIRLC